MTDKRVEVPEADGLTYKQRRKAQIREEKKRTKPSSKALAANSPGGRGKIGRPKGDAAKINEYKARMLASPKSKLVLDTIFDAAFNFFKRHAPGLWHLTAMGIEHILQFLRHTG